MEERPTNKGPMVHAPSSLTSSQTTEPPASLQRDLDDPAIADGVSPNGVPWHKRMLYTQANDSDESIPDDTSDINEEEEV